MAEPLQNFNIPLKENTTDQVNIPSVLYEPYQHLNTDSLKSATTWQESLKFFDTSLKKNY